jgi:phytoene dehydrogenase-like protein
MTPLYATGGVAGGAMPQHIPRDAVVVGAGPNGLAAAVTLARAGRSVLLIEAAETVGGGTRSAELTLPGFVHDVCSAVHPLGVASPFLASVPLHEHGLQWVFPEAEAAHPFDDAPAVVLHRSLDATAAGLGPDAHAYRRAIGPLVAAADRLLPALLAPPWPPPRDPLLLARFGWRAMAPARRAAERLFRTERARGFFAGLAAHSVLPLEYAFTAAFGYVFSLLGHVGGWPVARGGSGAIAGALAGYLRSLGGEIETGRRVASLDELPPARAVLLDLTPRQVLRLAGARLPGRYRRALERYRYGPAAFKLDLALSGPIPWKDPACALAATVHLGGTLQEIAASERAPHAGALAERPFVLLAQQSLFDPARAPAGRHTAWAYCHVPHGSALDAAGRIEAQIERFAPGFRDLVLARHVTAPSDFERYDENYVGGDIAGGSAAFPQLFLRPTLRLVPYATPDPRLFLCSSSTPPGAGVHGMCGYHAARVALARALR